MRPPFLADDEIFREIVLLILGAAPSLDVEETRASFMLTSDSGSSSGAGFEGCVPPPWAPLTTGDACTDELHGLGAAEGIVEAGITVIFWGLLVTDCWEGFLELGTADIDGDRRPSLFKPFSNDREGRPAILPQGTRLISCP
jgi:hypothetical protein